MVMGGLWICNRAEEWELLDKKFSQCYFESENEIGLRNIFDFDVSLLNA
jgi:hypothetical protein